MVARRAAGTLSGALFLVLSLSIQGRAQPAALPALPAKVGDLDDILARRNLRLIVAYSRTLYFIDRGRQLGGTAELGRAFEAWINARYKVRNGFHVVFEPTPRDRLFQALRDGRGDAVAANLTITPEREAIVDFSAPIGTGVKEIVVTGPKSPLLEHLDDLAGKDVRVRKSSSYATHLAALNATFQARGLNPMKIGDLPEEIEDEDAMEMVSAGMLPLAIVDKHKADIWVGVYPGLKARADLAVHDGGAIAWAIRKNSPKLKAELDAFMAAHAIGTSFGNTVYRRYFGGRNAVKSATSGEAESRFQALLETFRSVGENTGFDWLMLAAQGFQESGLDQSKRSHRGAVGVMQLLPATAASLGFSGVDRDATTNIRAGAAYMKQLMDKYVVDPGPDQTNRILMTFAAYNAGPGNLRKFRRAAKDSGADPNVWFDNVEQSAARIVGRETVQYVSNIYKYFIAYRMTVETLAKAAAAKAGEPDPDR